MYAQVNDEGQQYQILDKVIGHCKDNTAIPISYGMVCSVNGKLKQKVMACGHYHLCTFKDGLIDWVTLKELKKLNLIEVAEFAVANHCTEEPAYKWWVHKVLWGWSRIISKVKLKYWKTTHKFRTGLPHSAEEALKIVALQTKIPGTSWNDPEFSRISWK
jgi:hypothetical protein